MTASPLPVTAVIQQYLAIKQALGRRYDVERGVLRHLEAFLRIQRGPRDLTPATFAQWCLTQTHLASGVRRNWLRVVRNLCWYRRRTLPRRLCPRSDRIPELPSFLGGSTSLQTTDIARLLRPPLIASSPPPRSPLRSGKPSDWPSCCSTRAACVAAKSGAPDRRRLRAQ